jgi:hypothetical protein
MCSDEQWSSLVIGGLITASIIQVLGTEPDVVLEDTTVTKIGEGTRVTLSITNVTSEMLGEIRKLLRRHTALLSKRKRAQLSSSFNEGLSTVTYLRQPSTAEDLDVILFLSGLLYFVTLIISVRVQVEIQHVTDDSENMLETVMAPMATALKKYFFGGNC